MMPLDVPLYVTTSLEEAKKYAYETAAGDEEDGFPAEPIVVRFKFEHITKLALLPDNPGNIASIVTWEDSLSTHGSFAIERVTEETCKYAIFEVKIHEDRPAS